MLPSSKWRTRSSLQRLLTFVNRLLDAHLSTIELSEAFVVDDLIGSSRQDRQHDERDGQGVMGG